MISPTTDRNQWGANGAGGATLTCTSWDIWSELNQLQICVCRATVSHLPDWCDFICSHVFLAGRGPDPRSTETLSSRLPREQRGLHTPSSRQEGADQVG